MPSSNFFARARRVFQSSPQTTETDRPHLGATDSAQHSQYETDGSSYEMLVVETPSQPPPQPPSQPQQKEHNQHTPPQSKHQQQQRLHTPPPAAPAAPAAPAEPQTPSQKVPVALRRIDATPINLPETPGYNLRSRTRSQAPLTPQQRPTPARSRRREVRQAPSAHTTSGIAGRPALVSRRQIDESSYVTLRAMCRNFGLPTSGTKVQLRARALEKFERRRLLDEQTQQLGNETKLKEDSHDPCMSGQLSRGTHDAGKEKEQRAKEVQTVAQTDGAQEAGQGENCEEGPGKQITTSTVKPCGQVERLLPGGAIPSKSDEPSVHAKSDAPDTDPQREAVNPAELSAAKLRTPSAAQESDKVAQPTVSSTGVGVNSPESPRPPPPHPTPRLAEPPARISTQRRHHGPTESVDARGGDIDVATVFQDLASGHRKLSRAEYEAALRALKDNAPDRPQPMQVPINAAGVSLNTFPVTPFLKLPSVRAPATVSRAIPSQGKSPAAPNTLGGATSCAFPRSSAPVRRANQDLGETSNIRALIPSQEKPPYANRATQTENIPNAETTTHKQFVSAEKQRDGEGDNMTSNRDKEKEGSECQAVAVAITERKKPLETSPIPESSRNGNRANIEAGAVSQPDLAELNQGLLSAIFDGARGGPHDGNIVDMHEAQTQLQNAKAKPAALPEGDRRRKPRTHESDGDAHGDRELKRSGFGTPRELVRRFNRFGNGHLGDDEDEGEKCRDEGDPVTSLLRRNARRSSSGIPLFYSARGPSTAGRSIVKARPSSNAREAQDHLRRMDLLHNLSGRASFRVKRPLSASAGGLLVDLRRTSGSNGRPVQRMDQRGSFQAELARRPPPMAASALKILNELQKIQDENSALASGKRPVSPPPLPPSVVKRARRSGHFATSERHIDLPRPSMETGAEAVRKGYTYSPYALDRSSKSAGVGSSIPFGRQTPKIPLVAYGAGKKRSKRSRSNRLSSAVLSAVEEHVESHIEETGTHDNEENGTGGNTIAVKKRRRDGEDPSNTEEKIADRPSSIKSKGMSLETAKKSSARSTIDATNSAKGSLFSNAQVGQRNAPTSLFRVTNPANGRPTSVPNSLRVGQPSVSVSPTQAPLVTAAETLPVSRKGSSAARSVDMNLNKKVDESGKAFQPALQAEKDSVVFNKTSTSPPSTAFGQIEKMPTEETAGLDRYTAAKEKQAKELNEQKAGREAFSHTDDTVTGEQHVEKDKQRGKAGFVKTPKTPEALPSQILPKHDPFNLGTTEQFKDGGFPAPSGVSTAALTASASPFAADPGFPAVPFTRQKKSFPVEGESEKPEEENNVDTKQSAEISIPPKPTPSFGSFGGKQGSTGIFSAPSIPSDQGGSRAQFTFGTSPFTKSIQTEVQSGLQGKEVSAPIQEKDETGENEEVPALLQSQPAPLAIAMLKGFKEPTIPTSAQEANENANLEPPFEARSNIAAAPSSHPGFVAQADGKPEGPVSSKRSAPLSPNVEPLVGTKRDAPSNNIDAMATSTAPPSATGFKFGEKTEPSNSDEVVPAPDKAVDPFPSGPFSNLAAESQPQATFSFSVAPKGPELAPDGPFAGSQFESPFSSSGLGSGFVFGSSTASAAGVKPAPSISAPGPTTLDGAKNNPFAQPSSAAPFGAQAASQPGEMGQSSEPAFGVSSSSGLSTTFGKAASGFGNTFGSSQGSFFNTGVKSTFGVPSTPQAFGGSGDSSKTPVFGSVNLPATPFGAASGPAVAPTFGASSSVPASSDMFAAPSGGTSTAGLAGAGPGAGPGAFSFGNANAGAFGANASDSQPNPFNQGGNATSMSSAGMFGTAQPGAFNMGSATRAPPTQRRRLRGRRTLR